MNLMQTNLLQNHFAFIKLKEANIVLIQYLQSLLFIKLGAIDCFPAAESLLCIKLISHTNFAFDSITKQNIGAPSILFISLLLITSLLYDSGHPSIFQPLSMLLDVFISSWCMLTFSHRSVTQKQLKKCLEMVKKVQNYYI